MRKNNDGGLPSGEYREVHTETVRMPLENEAAEATGLSDEQWLDELHRDRTDDTLTDAEIPDAVRADPNAMARIAEQRSSDPAAEYARLKEQIATGRPFPIQTPQFEMTQVDITSFVKAQAQFLTAQTWFLEQRQGPVPEYVNALTHYSKAQRDLIRAQNDLLRQLGVI